MATDNRKSTPLICAARHGMSNIVKKLLELSDVVKVDAVDKDGRNALHWAASTEHSSIVQLLLDQKICIDAQDASGETALFRAAKEGRIANVKEMVSTSPLISLQLLMFDRATLHMQKLAII